MLRKIIAVVVCVCLMGTILIGCNGNEAENNEGSKEVKEAKTDNKSSSKSSKAEKPIILKFGHVNSEATSYHKGIMKFKEEVEAKTEGKIQVEVFPNSQLGNERDLFEGMQLGTVDCAFVATAPLAAFVPEMAILDAPFLFRNEEHAFKVADGEIGQKLSKLLLEKQGVHTMGFMNVGFRNVFSNKPVKKIEDLEGLKIRTMENKLHIATFSQIGALPTPMAYGEVFTALQQKTIDAAENAIQNVLNQKFYEVAPYVTKTKHFYCMCIIGISDKSLNKIPEDLRPAIFEAGKIATEFQRALSIKDNNNAADELKELGVEIYEIDNSKLAEMVEPVYEEFSDVIPPELVEQVKAVK